MLKYVQMVYFITDGEYVKIGYSEDVSKRLIQLQTGNPKTLSILKVVKGGYGLENSAHKFFDSYRVNNEWYSIDLELIDEFEISCNESRQMYKLRLENFTIVDYILWDFIMLNKKGIFKITESETSDLFAKRSFYNSKKKLVKLGFLKIGSKPKTYYVNKRYINL